MTTLLGIGLVLVTVGAYVLARVAAAKEGNDSDTGAITHADAKTAAKLVGENSVVILDIRTLAEFTNGHLAGARNLDFNSRDFESQLTALDKQQKYLVHCATGRRSTAALKLFKKLEFTSVVHLDGGIRAWVSAGHPVAK